MKTIIVACGGGIATSQTVAVKLGNMLEDAGISRGEFTIEAININSLPSYEKVADLYVSISPIGEKQYSLPTFSGVPFLTGMGAKEELEKIIQQLKK
ncbi:MULTISPECIES: PTS sugar transporter subunit IIB [Enterococcus]|uniref:PTS sugar transporter subunit IIB n=1 Tax=Enterococcus TaxID=1350 RepID=UPI000ED2EA4E|nr:MULTISPECIES: PTS sugar transporter subunit IIB [Enterococcus]MDT2702974.1 PTS sugar transporter subunit IIB [Enterococcus dongliensis]BBM16669.1 PTS galactitol transporter subunit IIB [Enterococcus avium]HCM86837.1 PTS galactitol transporter subunit IIB [Enterococcus sp.]